MEFALKPISRQSIPAAVEKAQRYRLLNEPWQAESICRDILLVEPRHQQALIILLLSLTDQFADGVSPEEALKVLATLEGDYERAYYAGIIWERSAHAHLRQGRPGGYSRAYEALRRAMELYARAETLRPEGNDEAILRWNACARLLMKEPALRPAIEEPYEPVTNE
jgi:hypothetical protein